MWHTVTRISICILLLLRKTLNSAIDLPGYRTKHTYMNIYATYILYSLSETLSRYVYLASASQTRVAPIQNRPPRVWDGTASSQYIAVGPRTSISVQFHNAYLSNYSCNQRSHLMHICCLPKTTLCTNDDL